MGELGPLRDLLENAVEELRDYLGENGDDEARDTMDEIADSAAPVNTWELIALCSDDNNLFTEIPDDLGDGRYTPEEVVSRNVYHRVLARLEEYYEEWSAEHEAQETANDALGDLTDEWEMWAEDHGADSEEELSQKLTELTANNEPADEEAAVIYRDAPLHAELRSEIEQIIKEREGGNANSGPQ